MKKKSIKLQKRLFLSKETIAHLNKRQQEGVAGGITAGIRCGTGTAATYDPQAGCETHPRPGYQCV